MNDKSLKAKACTEYVGEPNYVKFKYKGFDCEIKRHEYLLTLCGYASFRAKYPINNEKYRTVDFVKKEIERMVDQIIKINDQLSAE